jgi:spore maturation protein CgeB
LKIAFEKKNYPAVCTDFESVDNCLCTKYNISLLGNLNHGKNHIKKNHKNILWLAYSLNFGDKNINKSYFNQYIDLIEKNVKLYDVFAVSSLKIYNTLKDKLNIPVYYIPQFTNTEKFYPDYDESLKSDILFVGNNHFDRKAAKYAIIHSLPISIYGDGWPLEFTKGIYVDNRILRKYYSSAAIVLNDTMPSMKEFGFISNRIFDATASGAFVISDYMPEIEQMYGDSIPMWKSEEEFVKITKYYLNHPEERKIKAKRAREITLNNYTSKIIFPKFEKIIEEN